MTETAWSALRDLLAERYDELRKRLARRLGSEELARETLHETWLQLQHRKSEGSIGNPVGYLLRIALNVAIDRHRQGQRIARRFEVQAVLEDIPDEASSPIEQVAAREEIAALERAIEDLTPRRRAILLASRLEGIPLREIALRFGMSQRMVEIELKHALAHCADRLDRKVTRRFGPQPRKTS